MHTHTHLQAFILQGQNPSSEIVKKEKNNKSHIRSQQGNAPEPNPVTPLSSTGVIRDKSMAQ